MAENGFALQGHDIIKCQRCGRSEFVGFAAEQGWNVVVEDGGVSGYLCRECQAEDEATEQAGR